MIFHGTTKFPKSSCTNFDNIYFGFAILTGFGFGVTETVLGMLTGGAIVGFLVQLSKLNLIECISDFRSLRMSSGI